jgi:uncharacterized protein YndB with AHSA1/START domain
MIEPVRKTVTVKASPERAFEVFTEGFDTWWPREHHIGKSPMEKAIIECRLGGRLYSRQVDGTDCPWGSITAWEPPQRFVFAWQITAAWQFEADMSKTSEVEVRFTAEGDGATRVDLEHRNFDRMGEGSEAMRKGVDGEMGWGGLLMMFKTRVEA